jgi:hypothetical protein
MCFGWISLIKHLLPTIHNYAFKLPEESNHLTLSTIMTSNGTNGHTNGLANVTNGSSKSYSVPRETQHLFENGILKNTLIASTLPAEITECAKTVEFKGTDKPSIPINWRFAESISALKGLEAAMTNVLLKRKYGLEPQEAVIDT